MRKSFFGTLFGRPRKGEMLIRTAREIVTRSNKLRLKHVPQHDGHVSYCAIFCQSANQFEALDKEAKAIGKLANDTETGPVYVVPPIETEIGRLRVVKVRRPDQTRPERGDADFALRDYKKFKAEVLKRSGFKLIVREHFEMIELIDPAFDVRAYFSHPPVEEHPGIREALASQ